MRSRIEAKVSHRFQASAKQVYDTWLDPEKCRLWMMASLKSFGLSGEIRRIEIDACVGGKFFFSDMRDGVEAKHWGTYLELDRPRQIVFTWITSAEEEAEPSKVTLAIEPVADGCAATIVHEMDPKWFEYVSRVEGGWGRMLTKIDELLGAVS